MIYIDIDVLSIVFKCDSLTWTHSKLRILVLINGIHLLKRCLSESAFRGHRRLCSLILHLKLFLNLLKTRIIVVRVQWICHLPICNMHCSVPSRVCLDINVFSLKIISSPGSVNHWWLTRPSTCFLSNIVLISYNIPIAFGFY